MNYLSVENITKSYADKVLFNQITFGIEKGQKVALVAKNGTGKTSLLNIITGNDVPEEGTVTLRKEITVGFLNQESNFDENATVSDVVFNSDNPILNVIRHYEECVQKNDAEQLQEAFEQMDRLEAWDYEVKVKQILGKLKVEAPERKIGTLSGGQKKRLALAKVLIEEPDLFILDEPTNHLDFEMIEWLEHYLEQPHITLFMVTHDRYFLDRVCNEIIELEDEQLFKYKGNYSYYLQKRAERIEVARSEVDKAKNLFRKELEWVRRQPKARGTKAKYRVDAFQDVKEKAHQNLEEQHVKLEINMNRLGSKILELHNIKKRFGDVPILNNFKYIFKRKERIGIVGKNGVGKTTFLNLIMGLEQPDGGKIVTGETVVFGYYSQEGIQLKEGKRVIEVVKDIAEVIPLTKGKKLSAAQLLERFLFSREKQYQYVSKLSGGEKRRLYLLTLFMKNPNFLILDEPTNDLDIVTLNILEDFLEDFPGCLLIVSHDRHFMDKLVDHLFVFEGEGEVKDFIGNYSDYREYQKQKDQAARQTEKAVKEKTQPKAPKEKTKLSYKEKLEFEQLEKDIESLELRKAEITNLLNSGTLAGDELQELSVEFAALQEQLETKSDRWLELSEWV